MQTGVELVMPLKCVTIGAIIAITLSAIVPDYNSVNASGFGRCDADEPEDSTSCKKWATHPEEYCKINEEDPFCDDVDICDDEGDATSEDMFCTSDAVRTDIRVLDVQSVLIVKRVLNQVSAMIIVYHALSQTFRCGILLL
jgi:hypothetical protein